MPNVYLETLTTPAVEAAQERYGSRTAMARNVERWDSEARLGPEEAAFIAARDDDYLSWTDGRIQVRVPSLNADNHPAGSGRVRVVAAGQDPVVSPQALTVIFAVANAQATESRRLDQPGHVTLNERGGLSFQLTAGFQASPAAAACSSQTAPGSPRTAVPGAPATTAATTAAACASWVTTAL